MSMTSHEASGGQIHICIYTLIKNCGKLCFCGLKNSEDLLCAFEILGVQSRIKACNFYRVHKNIQKCMCYACNIL